MDATQATGHAATATARVRSSGGWAPAVIVAIALIAYDRYFRERPGPYPYEPPLATAAARYAATLPDAFTTAARRVRESSLQTDTQLIDFVRANNKPFTDELERATKTACDAKGAITNPQALAADLESVAEALRKGVR